MSTTSYSVVIVDYDTHADVVRLRNELRHQGNPEVIVIDAKEKTLGYGAALNMGVEQANNEYIVCMNPDITLKRDALPNLVADLQAHPECGMVGPQILDRNGRVQITSSVIPTAFQSVVVWSWLSTLRKKSIDRWYRLRNFHHQVSRYVPSVSGACFAIRRSEWLLVGGADETLFLYFEEFDLAQRLADVKLRVRFCAESVIVHYGQTSTATIHGVSRIFRASRRYWLEKHYGFQGSLAASWLEFWEQRV